MFREIVMEIMSNSPGIDAVMLRGPWGAIANTVARGDFDALLTCGSAHEGETQELIRRAPNLRVVDLDRDAGEARIYSLVMLRERLTGPSPADLLAALADPEDASPDGPARQEGGPIAHEEGRLLRMNPNWPFDLRRPRPRAGSPPPEAAVATNDTAGLSEAIAAEVARLAARIERQRRRAAPETPSGDGEPHGLALALARDLRAGGAAESRSHAGEWESPLRGLERAKTLFGLTAAERDLLFIAGIVEIDARVGRLIALLNEHAARRRPTVGLAVDLVSDGETGAAHALYDRILGDGPLQQLALIELEPGRPLADSCISLRIAVWPRLFGLRAALPFECVELTEDRVDRLDLPPGLAASIEAVADWASRRRGKDVLVMTAGQDPAECTPVARAVAARLRPRALIVDAAALTEPTRIAELEREARWNDASVILGNPLAATASTRCTLGRALSCPILVVGAPDAVRSVAVEAEREAIDIELPPRHAEERLRLWRGAAPGGGAAADIEEADLERLADRFDFNREQIAAALRLARVRAESAGRSGSEFSDVLAACETLRDARFGDTARRLPCPYGPDDIVLRPETARELDLVVAWARHGRHLFGGGGPGAGLHAAGGLACLFSGPPGTGKTMAAQIIARRIDYALYRIDLAQVVDKYIGETEKRLSTLFDEAQRARVALFFDEADALFGKRTEIKDAHDRYANIAVDHLLQKIDGFDGLAILATNILGNVDDAFLRRVQVKAQFLAPNADERRAIWGKLLPAAAEREDYIDLPLLASEPLALVGGEIRNAIFTAHLLAAEEGCRLGMRHLVIGLWRELAKAGRIVDVANLGRWRALVQYGALPSHHVRQSATQPSA